MRESHGTLQIYRKIDDSLVYRAYWPPRGPVRGVHWCACKGWSHVYMDPDGVIQFVHVSLIAPRGPAAAALMVRSTPTF
jgi:hypothetical protein